jgi:hypothetical protein
VAQSVKLLPGALIAPEAPDGLRVLFAPTLVRELRARAIEAFVSLPRRGVEIGGVLYGHPGADGVHIETFAEAPCEHKYGPSYALSAADREQLAELIAQPHAAGAPLAGFFRSFTSREPLIEAADEEFVRQHFPRGPFVFLMLQPLSAQNCLASLRFFRDGELLPETDTPPFSFDPAKMQPEPEDTPLPEPPAPSILSATPLSATPAPILPPAHRSRLEAPAWAEEAVPEPRRRTPWWMPVTICLLCGILGAAAHELWRLRQEPRWIELHLDAKTAGDRLAVTWDGSAARLIGATHGLLSVRSGQAQHEIELTPQQIRAGRYDDVATPGDASVRLTLYAKGMGVSGDSVRIVSAPPAAPALPKPEQASAPAPAEPVTATTSPQAIHEVQPAVPPGIRSRIDREIAIPVEVQVTARGGVSRAAAQTAGLDGLSKYLAGQAEKAALQWRFKPAKSRRGVPVASAKTLNFVFTPSP